MNKVRWIAICILFFGMALNFLYGSFVVNVLTENRYPYISVRQQQQLEFPVSSRQSELCSCQCKLDRNDSFIRHGGDLDVISKETESVSDHKNVSSNVRGFNAENSPPDEVNVRKHLIFPLKSVLKLQKQDRQFSPKLDKVSSTHSVSVNGILKEGLQDGEKLQNFSRETRSSHNIQNWRTLPRDLYKLAPNIFDSVPKEFLPQFKNPCWYEKKMDLLCLPYFYILGFPKCGTTDIWDKINNHPKVEQTTVKEPQYWRDRRIGTDKRGFRHYLSNAKDHKSRLLSGDTQAVYCDGSATTIISNYRFVRYSSNVTNDFYTNADIIKEITPDAKIIIAIREPVERLFSGYLYHPTKEVRSAWNFHKEALKYVKDFKRCLERSSKLKCVFEKAEEDGNSQRLKVGIYAPLIKHWITRFGSDQVMVIRVEDWKLNCTSILPNIFKFLELRTLTKYSVRKLCKKPSQNVNLGNHRKVGDMYTSTKQLLQDFYAPFNKELSEYLNISLYHAKV